MCAATGPRNYLLGKSITSPPENPALIAEFEIISICSGVSGYNCKIALKSNKLRTIELVNTVMTLRHVLSTCIMMKRSYATVF